MGPCVSVSPELAMDTGLGNTACRARIDQDTAQVIAAGGGTYPPHCIEYGDRSNVTSVVTCLLASWAVGRGGPGSQGPQGSGTESRTPSTAFRTRRVQTSLYRSYFAE